jgi:hypothetical protein
MFSEDKMCSGNQKIQQTTIFFVENAIWLIHHFSIKIASKHGNQKKSNRRMEWHRS